MESNSKGYFVVIVCEASINKQGGCYEGCSRVLLREVLGEYAPFYDIGFYLLVGSLVFLLLFLCILAGVTSILNPFSSMLSLVYCGEVCRVRCISILLYHYLV